MNEEQKQAIKDTKDILKELDKHKDKDFIGRLYYKNKPIENILQILLNLIDEQQKEIELMKTKINKIVLMIKENYNSDFYDDYETIAGLRDDIYNLLMKNNIGE